MYNAKNRENDVFGVISFIFHVWIQTFKCFINVKWVEIFGKKLIEDV